MNKEYEDAYIEELIDLLDSDVIPLAFDSGPLSFSDSLPLQAQPFNNTEEHLEKDVHREGSVTSRTTSQSTVSTFSILSTSPIFPSDSVSPSNSLKEKRKLILPDSNPSVKNEKEVISLEDQVLTLIEASEGEFGPFAQEVALRYINAVTLDEVMELITNYSHLDLSQRKKRKRSRENPTTEAVCIQSLFSKNLFAQLTVQAHHLNDIRLQRNFILVPETEQFFYPGVPIAVNFQNDSFVHVDQNKVSKHLFGDARMQPPGVLQVSNVHYLTLLSYIMPVIKEMSSNKNMLINNTQEIGQKELWFRQYVSLKGVPCWLLCRMTKQDTGGYMCYSQIINETPLIQRLQYLPPIDKPTVDYRSVCM